MIPPTPPRAPRRSVLLRILATLVAAAPLAACGPAPVPTPAPTAAFASEEEAFAAAEETYRAYTDALNAVDPADPETFEATYEHSSGTVQEADRENFSTMHAEMYTLDGDAVITNFVGEQATFPFDMVVATVCVDVSAVRVRDRDGNSVVNPNRPDVYEVRATFEGNDGRLLVDGVERTEGTTCNDF